MFAYPFDPRCCPLVLSSHTTFLSVTWKIRIQMMKISKGNLTNKWPVYLTIPNCRYILGSVVIEQRRGPPESPWQASPPFFPLASPAQMSCLSLYQPKAFLHFFALWMGTRVCRRMSLPSAVSVPPQPITQQSLRFGLSAGPGRQT